MKKLLSTVLILTLLFSVTIAPVSASAATYVTAKDSDFSGTKNGEFQYYGTAEYVKIPATIKGVAVTSYDFMFANTKYVKGVISDNPNIVSTIGMFTNNQADTLDIDIVTSSVKNMIAMFEGAQTRVINFSDRFDVSKVENMAFMFAWTDAPVLDLTAFSTPNLKNTYSMFQNSKAKTIKLNFTTDKVEQMDYMFYRTGLSILDLSSFTFKHGVVADSMFDDNADCTVYVKTKHYADYLRATFINRYSPLPKASYKPATFLVK
jgi:hypothetical protein